MPSLSPGKAANLKGCSTGTDISLGGGGAFRYNMAAKLLQCPPWPVPELNYTLQTVSLKTRVHDSEGKQGRVHRKV